jgi:hypothetical protein
VVVYADGSNVLQALSPDGISQSIPAGTLPLKVGAFPSAPLVALSPNRRAMAALNFSPGRRLSVTIAALGVCCTTVIITSDNVIQANIGAFSPNQRRFAVSYRAQTGDNQFEAGIATVDVELGAVVARLQGSRIGGDYALLRDWDDSGIRYLPVCADCDLYAYGTLRRWNPDTDDLNPDAGYYDTTQDTLAATGETITPVRRADFPLPIAEDTAINNVLAYEDADGSARAIYYNPNSLQITAAHWVADGWQILIEHPDGAILLDRAGVKHPLAVNDQFLVGTPDGWLATRAINGAVEVVYHTLANPGGKLIARFYHPITVVEAPPLGATATRGGFPGIASPVRQITCPNALPPRLITGGKGRTISGSVNLRREPSLTSTSVATISAEVFDVIGGPNCDPTGIAWWQVGLGGLRGWMAESKDGVYLLQPVLH